MKYLLVIALALLVLWLWRHSRQDHPPLPKSTAKVPARLLPTEIVACAVCQVHLPKAEALTGPDGFYCGPAHRRQAGR